MAAEFIDVWVNCPDRQTAEAIAEACIAAKLAACANVFPLIASIYRWKGAVERADEVPLLLKSRAALFERLCAAVRERHPYETPSIVAVPLELIDCDYAEWLAKETDLG